MVKRQAGGLESAGSRPVSLTNFTYTRYVFKRLNFISSDRLVILALAIIFCLGLFLRLYRLADFTGWQDSARDFMVAERILELKNGQGLLIAPLSAGSSGYLNNSSVYYYFIAVLSLVLPHPLLITGFVAVLGSLAIPFNFLLAKKIGDDGTGLVAAFLTAISFVLISHSNTLFQPSFMPAFISFFFLSLVLAYERRSFFWSLISLVIFWWFFHLHYSILIMIPALLFAFLNISKEISKTNWGIQKIVYLLVVFLVGGLLWYSLSNIFTSFDLVNFVSLEVGKSASVLSPGVLLLKVGNVYQQFVRLFMPLAGQFTIVALITSTIGLTAIDVFQKRQQQKNLFVETQLVLVFLSISLFALFSREISDSYFIFFITLLPVLFAQLVGVITRWRKLLGLSAFLLMATFLNSGNQRLSSSAIGSYEGSQIISEHILSDMEDQNISDLSQVFVSSKNKNIVPYNWFSPKYWYFLEKKTNQVNTTLTKNFNNLSWNSYNPVYVYLVCEDFELLNKQEAIDRCVRPYQEKFTFIFEDEYRTLVDERINESIFVFTTRQGEGLKFSWPFSYSLKKNDGE